MILGRWKIFTVQCQICEKTTT